MRRLDISGRELCPQEKRGGGQCKSLAKVTVVSASGLTTADVCGTHANVLIVDGWRRMGRPTDADR